MVSRRGKSRGGGTHAAARAALLAFVLVFLAVAPAGAATLKADFRFQGSRASSVGTAPAVTDATSPPSTGNRFATETIDGSPHTVLRFPRRNGLTVGTTGSKKPSEVNTGTGGQAVGAGPSLEVNLAR